MHTSTKGRCAASRRMEGRAGFTLIELLVVIAIIGILAAIIFPIFTSVRENARETTTMSNLHNISAALALYKLDNRRYPDVLFGYACGSSTQLDSTTGKPCKDDQNGNPLPYAVTMANVATIPNNHDLLVGLYPEYIKDWQSFTSPNNPITDPSAVTENSPTLPTLPTPITLGVNVICPKKNTVGTDYVDAAGGKPCDTSVNAAPANYPNGGYLEPAQQYFFTEDAMDISPQVANPNQLLGASGPWTYMPRYQTSWLSYDNGPTNNNNANDPDYDRQLRWQNPPANTYVTAVTYHVPNSNKIIILFESGTAVVQKLSMAGWWFSGPVTAAANDTGSAEGGYIDNRNSSGSPYTSIAVTTAGGNSPAAFWRFQGNH